MWSTDGAEKKLKGPHGHILSKQALPVSVAKSGKRGLRWDQRLCFPLKQKTMMLVRVGCDDERCLKAVLRQGPQSPPNKSWTSGRLVGLRAHRGRYDGGFPTRLLICERDAKPQALNP